MTNNKNIAVTIVLVTIALCIFLCKGKEYGDPAVFEDTIIQFEQADSLKLPPQNAIVVIGSSSIRGWHGTIQSDLSPQTIIPRGFGGSNMNDALHYLDRIVLPYNPRAVVIYEGDNDIAQGISPQKINNTFKALVKEIHSNLPNCRIYFLSIKPSYSRWIWWKQMVETNKLIEEYCTNDSQLIYVDIATPMLNEQGLPKEEIFLTDNLHMNSLGYEIWTNVLKPILLEMGLEHE